MNPDEAIEALTALFELPAVRAVDWRQLNKVVADWTEAANRVVRRMATMGNALLWIAANDPSVPYHLRPRK